MYSQYQSYQQHAGGVAGQQWNGTSWVSCVKPGTSSTYTPAASSYQPTTAAAPVAAPSATDQNASLVTKYSQYYYQWHSRAIEQRKSAESLQSEAKAQMLLQAQWSDYYADQSTRAVYHYKGTHVQPTPPPLPPAPPQTQPSSAPVSSQPVTTQPQAQRSSSRWASGPPATSAAPRTNAATASQNDAPGGMREYVHKCLAQCSTDEQRQYVQKEVEKIITSAIQQGTMHTMNWDQLELIPLGNKSAGTPDVRPKKKSRTDSRSHNGTSDSTGYYGPAGGKQFDSTRLKNESYYGKGAGAAKKAIQRKKNRNESYYGRSSSKDSYDEKLPVNDSYYGSNKKDFRRSASRDSYDNESYYGSGSTSAKESVGFGDEDYVAFKRSPKVAKGKKVLAKAGGFERSTAALAKRATRFSGRGGVSSASSLPSSTGHGVHRYMGLAVIGGTKKLDDNDYERMTVKGTCQQLEKEYLRLTAPPRAKLVRPQHILEQHLENLKLEFKLSKRKKRDYTWFCSQLKSVRQDLTVQRINNDFAVDAYETHARIALQEGDLNEYNQCQTQLKELYDRVANDKNGLKNRNEFIAYRLIYYVFLTGNKKYEEGSSDLFKIMLSLTPEQREDPCVDHALKVRVAVAEYDYHAFFRLQDTCPKLGAYLMDFMVPNVRFWALQRVCKAYRPSIPVVYVLQELGFDTEDANQVEDGVQWLKSCGCVLTDDGKTLLCKDSIVRESDLSTKTSLI